MDLFAPSHLLILLVIILIIFGPSKLGDVGGALGRAARLLVLGDGSAEVGAAADASDRDAAERRLRTALDGAIAQLRAHALTARRGRRPR